MCICSQKSKLRDVVSRVALSLKANRKAVVLGKSSTIGKAVTVSEIIKRELPELTHATRIYKHTFGKKNESCIEVSLEISEQVQNEAF